MVRPLPDELIYANGVNGLTGEYLLEPLTPPELAARVSEGAAVEDALAEKVQEAAFRATEQTFDLPFWLDKTDISQVGWGIVLATDERADVRDALQPLVSHRRAQAGDAMVKVLEHRSGEDDRDWLERHQVAPGNIVPERVPYYLLLIGSPERIPFDFQYLLDVEYAVGRLDLDDADGYDRYVQSLLRQERGADAKREAAAAFFGTRHPGDKATQLSADMLVEPLAASLEPGGLMANAVPSQRIDRVVGDAATKDALAELLAGTGARGRPALLFSASHGLGGWPVGHPDQQASHGALLCQDWPGAGQISDAHYLTGADVPAEADVAGMIAFFFACYGGGTPRLDSFSHGSPGPPPVIADPPFVARLPKTLLEAGALAVIGHVERAWGYSFLSGQTAQLLPFQNAIGQMLSRIPVGQAMSDFHQKFATLSAGLSAIIENVTFGQHGAAMLLASRWTERNDAQNYVLLGDPAARLA